MEQQEQKQKIVAYIPNTLTLLRITMGGMIIGLFFFPHPLWWAQLLIVGGIISDKLDGSLARAMKVESELGKRLESIADPIFSFAGTVYIYLFLGLPTALFWAGAAGLGAISLARLFVSRRAGKMFYWKHPITRFGVGMVFGCLLMYMFEIPYREPVAWAILAYGYIGAINYTRMMVQFLKQGQSTAEAEA